MRAPGNTPVIALPRGMPQRVRGLPDGRLVELGEAPQRLLQVLQQLLRGAAGVHRHRQQQRDQRPSHDPGDSRHHHLERICRHAAPSSEPCSSSHCQQQRDQRPAHNPGDPRHHHLGRICRHGAISEPWSSCHRQQQRDQRPPTIPEICDTIIPVPSAGTMNHQLHGLPGKA